MTIISANSAATYRGDDVATEFPFTFYVPSTDDLIVTVYNDDGTYATLNTAQYTLDFEDDNIGGTITYPLSGDPLTTTARLGIARIVPFTQEATLSNQGGFYPQVIEQALDALEMQIQQTNDGVLQVAPGLPAGVVRPGRENELAKWDEDGNLIGAGFNESDTSIFSYPASLDNLTSPNYIRSKFEGFNIFEFAGGQTERAKETSTADYMEVGRLAVNSGEKIIFPRWEYPVRTVDEDGNGVLQYGDQPVHISCESGTVFIAGDPFWQSPDDPDRTNRYMFTFTQSHTGGGSVIDDYDRAWNSLVWEGGRFDATALTAARGRGASTGGHLFNIERHFRPIVRGVEFFCGLTEMSETSGGAGAIDTAYNSRACFGEIIENCRFVGAVDLGVYISGQYFSTDGSNKLATTNGSPLVTVTWPDHGASVGDTVYISSTASIGGLSINGEYTIASLVSGDEDDKFRVTAGSNASATVASGGGTVSVVNVTKTDDMSKAQGGIWASVRNNSFYRCGQGVSFKRGFQHYDVKDNFFLMNGGAILASDVDVGGATGRHANITGNRIFKTQNQPIRVESGDNCQIINNIIRNFGKTRYNDGGDFVDIGQAVAAIDLRTVDRSFVDGNFIGNDAGTPWADMTGADTSAKNPVGIRLTRIDANSNGSDFNIVSKNIIDGVRRGVQEANSDDNQFLDNLLINIDYEGKSLSGARTVWRDAGDLSPERTPTLPIVSGHIEITGPRHRLATEGAAALDELTHIDGASVGNWLVLFLSDTSEKVLIKHLVGNIECGEDLLLNSVNDVAYFTYAPVGAVWRLVALQRNVGINPQLTIAAGVVTATEPMHRLAPESGTADDLVTLNGRMVGATQVLTGTDGNLITVKHLTGNIRLAGYDIVLASAADSITLYQHSAGQWMLANLPLLLSNDFRFPGRTSGATVLRLRDNLDAVSGWETSAQIDGAAVMWGAVGSSADIPAGMAAKGTASLHFGNGTSGTAFLQVDHTVITARSPVDIATGTFSIGGVAVIDASRNGTLASLTLTTDLAVADGGTGASTASGARTNLGLGTAATQNTGTSGANVPLLNGANTWSAMQTFSSGELRLQHATANIINMWVNGFAAPAVPRSIGAKIVLFDASSTSNVDFAIGIEVNYTWFANPANAFGWKFYTGTSHVATIGADGSYTVAGATLIDGSGYSRLKTTTVGTLPAAGTPGRKAFATNGRAYNGAGTLEGAGTGTGVEVVDNGTAWKVAGTNQTVQA